MNGGTQLDEQDRSLIIRDGESPIWRWTALLIVLLGIGLRIWQYVANPSIWVDEGALARNIINRSPSQLLKPLDYAQVASPGFLLAVKLAVAAWGDSEFVLRLVPLIAGVISVPLFFQVARTLLDRTSSLVATCLFSTAIPLIFFSSALKQYSSDVAIMLAITHLALGLQHRPLTRLGAGRLVVVAALLLLCSQTAVFPLTVAGLVVFVDAALSHRQDKRLRMGMVAVWAVIVIGAVSYGVRTLTPLDDIYLHRFWARAFMPDQGRMKWLWSTLQSIIAGSPSPFDGSLNYAWPALFTALAVCGAVGIALGGSWNAAIVAGPIVLTLLASAARMYPFGTRAGLFLLPLFLLLISAGAELVGRIVVRPAVAGFAAALVLSFAFVTLLREHPPRRPEHLRPVMQYVADRWQRDDSMWVYYGAGQAFGYYSRRFPFAVHATVGDCNRDNPREYLRQLDTMRGRRRVWILMAHGSAVFLFDERRLVTSYLDTIGRRLDQFRAPSDDATSSRAEVILYDLSDRERLDTTSPDQVDVSKTYVPQPWSCYGVMSVAGPNARAVEAVLHSNAP